MAESKYEPIVVGEAELHAFAERAAAFCAALTADERRMWQTIVARAGGTGDTLDAERMAESFAAIWEDGTTIAPLYSGDMPETSYSE